MADFQNPSLGEMQQQSLPLAFIRGEAMVEKPQDLFIPPDALKVILEAFEGPLDLLLYLIKKQKFDILDLPIAPITEQYMQYVELMKDLNMELAAEYLVMASILAEIKSRLLLPKQQVEEVEDDPRAELIRRLQEYEMYKQAAEDLDQLPRLDRDVFVVELPLADVDNLVENHPDVELKELVLAFQDVLKRSQAFEHHHITRESLSTRERMSQILTQLGQLEEKSFLPFSQLFEVSEGKHGVVVTFLAMLELIKELLIECQQASVFGEIHLRLKQNLQAV
ncbi:segregation and condensation protein A [Thalassotalea marina]|uniref:Segregation and condensation protein A n=1 Tax=Thalassotalea marina TaxID=1673741 RepID=A0A919BQI2_9GAMM|nr:segregation/condensation protein A [Thalassotalea marina]GHG06543.1 segregation and condensation protein A [Thalassotalea marina]